MTVGIIGLGLIGGSFAKAYTKSGHDVYACDTDTAVEDFAILCGAIKAKLTDEILPTCDLILICIYPEAAVKYMEEKGELFKTKPTVIDCCGTKRNIVSRGQAIAERYGFTYVGGHPMAGTQFSGFKYSRDDLFNGAPMVIVPKAFDDVEALAKIKEKLMPAGFASIQVTTAEKHDEIIAFTSQLAHIVSSAYIKSPTAKKHHGFSAGSYRDMTRVALLKPDMWTQLFLDNTDCLINEIDCITNNLSEYRAALASGDRETLLKLLDDGRRLKEEVDG